ncbi:sporulation protein [Laceyella putida]|uniref:Sporulation protein n=1 Tax=Laceyella putida TaxID=110101 RepID=A0ABW2RHD8_9BACL
MGKVNQLFKDLMARFGKGAAKVDLILNRNQFQLGDVAEGKLVIQGGAAEQKINKIDVRLMVVIRYDETEYVHAVTSIPFYESFTIHPGEYKEFPFQCQLPYDLMISGHYVTYFFNTELDIAGGIDQKDRDYIEILCPQSLQQVLNALNHLGFREKHDSRKFNGHVQEFAFFPTDFLQGKAEELEFVVAVQPDGVRLLLELDLISFGHEKELKREVFIPNHLLESEDGLVSELKRILEEMAEYAHTDYHHDSHYGHSYHGHSHHGHGHHSSGMAGAVGGFAAGVVGAMVVNEMLDNDDGDDDDGGLEGFFEDED